MSEQNLKYHQYGSWLLFAVISGFFLFLALQMPVAYIWMTYEDLYGEWFQMWLFLMVCILALLNSRRDGAYRWFFLALAGAGFFTAMEEISWGQRLLDIDSPEFFAANNVQGETNIHNLLTGPRSTLLKDIIEYTLATALVVYGLVYPLLLRFRTSVALALSQRGLAPPPLHLWVFFVTAAVFEVGAFNFNEAEVAEILVGTALNLMLLQYLYMGEADAGGIAPPGLGASLSCARTSVFIIALLALLAVMTTRAIYSSPDMNERVRARVVNGYEKYAGRFEERGDYARAADFYRRVYKARPEQKSMLRAAIRNYAAAGDDWNYRQYYQVLLDEKAAAAAARPTVENLLAIAASYGDIEASEAEQDFLQRALQLAEQNAAARPENAASFYWLGRARQERGDYSGALQAYQQASAISPNVDRYATAVRLMRQFVAGAESSSGD